MRNHNHVPKKSSLGCQCTALGPWGSLLEEIIRENSVSFSKGKGDNPFWVVSVCWVLGWGVLWWFAKDPGAPDETKPRRILFPNHKPINKYIPVFLWGKLVLVMPYPVTVDRFRIKIRNLTLFFGCLRILYTEHCINITSLHLKLMASTLSLLHINASFFLSSFISFSIFWTPHTHSLIKPI